MAGEVVISPVKNLALPDGESSDICPHVSDAGLERDSDVGSAGFHFDKFNFAVEGGFPDCKSLFGGGAGIGSEVIGDSVGVDGVFDFAFDEDGVRVGDCAVVVAALHGGVGGSEHVA